MSTITIFILIVCQHSCSNVANFATFTDCEKTRREAIARIDASFHDKRSACVEAKVLKATP